MESNNFSTKAKFEEKNETSLEINGEASSNPEAVANKFNEYFSSIAANLAEKIPTVNVDPLSYISR